MTRFVIVPQWQGSPSARAMQLIEGAGAIAGDLPASARHTVDVPLEAGDALGSTVHRLSALTQVRRALDEALTEIAGRTDLAAVGVTGKPFIFAVGADLKGAAALRTAPISRPNARSAFHQPASSTSSGEREFVARSSRRPRSGITVWSSGAGEMRRAVSGCTSSERACRLSSTCTFSGLRTASDSHHPRLRRSARRLTRSGLATATTSSAISTTAACTGVTWAPTSITTRSYCWRSSAMICRTAAGVTNSTSRTSSGGSSRCRPDSCSKTASWTVRTDRSCETFARSATDER